MKSPSEIARSFIEAMPADRAARCQRAFDVLLPAVAGAPIYNSEFDDAKKLLDRSFEEAVTKLKDDHRPSNGYWDENKNVTPWGTITSDQGYISGVRNSIAEQKKLAKLRIDHPLVTELRALYAVAIPVAELLDALKKKALKGRRPAAVSSKQKRIAGRSGGSATCQICAGNQALVSGKIALHGYERPGHGYITGRCFGAGKLPYEVACDALKTWIGMLRKYLTDTHDQLAALPFRKEFMIEVYKRDAAGHMIYERRQPVMKFETIYPEHPQFEGARESAIRKAKNQISQLASDIEIQQKRLAAWVPATGV